MALVNLTNDGEPSSELMVAAAQHHTLATEILSKGGSDQDAADVLGNSPHIIRKHYAKWNVQRQDRIKSLMQTAHFGTFLAQKEKAAVSC